MRRGCFIVVIGMLVLCLVACGAGYFIGLPRFQESARNEIRDAISTEVAQQIPSIDGSAEPGSYTLNEAELQEGLAQNFDVQSVDNLQIRITPTAIEFVLDADGGEDISYTGVPVAVNGRLEMTNMESSEGFFDFFFPADELGRAIEEAVNTYLSQNGLQVDAIELADGEMTIVTVATP
ncbi:MAG: hypothetical protein IT336_07610 [Thermomicrobiales bacterium]|nr:hypothetical protein [Thermomicrobiales bacterium]